MGDLIWMRESGMEAAVLKEASRGKLIFGVCGGYQMLGETLSDPHGVENGGSMKGMGLLPMETVFAEKKTRTRVQGHFGQLSGVFAPLSGAEIEGYEIHMGESILKDNAGTATKITDSVSGKKKEEHQCDTSYRFRRQRRFCTKKRHYFQNLQPCRRYYGWYE